MFEDGEDNTHNESKCEEEKDMQNCVRLMKFYVAIECSICTELLQVE